MGRVLATVISVVFLLTAVVLLIWGFSTGIAWFLSLSPATMTPIAALVGLILVPIITYFTTRSLERRRTLETSIRLQKTKLYDDMMRGLLRIVNLQKTAPMTEQETLQFFAELTPPLISYGSRGVILAWNKFRKVSINGVGDGSKVMIAFEDVLKAIRKDLGHGVFMHQQGELLRIFINNVDETLNEPNK